MKALIAVLMVATLAGQTGTGIVPFPSPLPASGFMVQVLPGGVLVDPLADNTPAASLPGKYCVAPTPFIAIDATAVYSCDYAALAWVATPYPPPGTN